VNIRFISSLNPDDEARLAPALTELIGALLDQLPFAYTLRVETTAGAIFQRTHATSRKENDSCGVSNENNSTEGT
jgi:hypothetical protein